MKFYEVWGVAPGENVTELRGTFSDERWQFALKMAYSLEKRGFKRVRLKERTKRKPKPPKIAGGETDGK